MQRIRAAFRDDAHVTAQRTPKFGLAARCYHLELIHHIEAVENTAQARCIVICGESIDDEAVGKVPLAADRQSLSRHCRSFREQLVARGVGRRDTGN